MLSSSYVSYRLPLDPIMLVISELLPKVHDLQASLSKANITPAIIDFLSSASLSHVLPQTPRLSPRRFVVSSFIVIVFSQITLCRLVVGCFDHLVDVFDLGRNICSWYDAVGHLELDDCQIVLR